MSYNATPATILATAHRKDAGPASVASQGASDRLRPWALEVTNLSIEIAGRTLVDRASFRIKSGERACLIGASGSGKSLTAGAILGQLPANAVVSGSILVSGVEVLGVPASKRPDRARVAAVFHDSAVALNPLVRLRDQLIEPLRKHHGLSRERSLSVAIELAGSVGLPDPARILDRYSGELSGGQRQRICIALALACNTGLLVADEPTSALDVVTQQRVLAVLRRYTAGEDSPSLLFITHDLAVASALCQSAIVLHSGKVVEQGPLSTVLTQPANEYTQELIRAARAAALPARRRDTSPSAAPETAPEPSVELAPASSEPFFRIQDVSRSYRLPRRSLLEQAEIKTALAPTSLDIAPGERVGIVGVSGSGKTTLLRLMLALEPSDTGTIACDGREVYPASVRALRWYRQRVQYVPQDPASTLDPRMSVRRLMQEPLARLRVGGDHARMIVSALESVGLGESFQRRRVSELSGGQAQRVALARALVTRPKFLLADEPVSGLDLPMREQVILLLQRISANHGTGIVVVSHDLSMIASLCPRTVVLHDGAVVEDRRTDAVLADPRHPRTRELLDAIPTLTPNAA